MANAAYPAMNVMESMSPEDPYAILIRDTYFFGSAGYRSQALFFLPGKPATEGDLTSKASRMGDREACVRPHPKEEGDRAINANASPQSSLTYCNGTNVSCPSHLTLDGVRR